MSVSVVSDVWFTFNIREDKLKGYAIGTQAEVYVPAVDKTIPVRITLMKDVGSFAVWKATKALDDLDLKTFEVQGASVEADGRRTVRNVGCTENCHREPAKNTSK